jgi:hypothetical protein
MEKGSISTFFKIEAPVVEKPDADSKNASINEGIVPLIRYGSDPNSENKIQDIVTVRKVSLLLISSVLTFLVKKRKSRYKKPVTSDDQRNGKRDSL